MGLAASQARLLTITSRLSNTELRQQQIANTKMRLANDQENVSTKYSEALNNQTLKLNDKTLTYNDLVGAGYNVMRTSDNHKAEMNGVSTTTKYTKPVPEMPKAPSLPKPENVTPVKTQEVNKPAVVEQLSIGEFEQEVKAKADAIYKETQPKYAYAQGLKEFIPLAQQLCAGLRQQNNSKLTSYAVRIEEVIQQAQNVSPNDSSKIQSLYHDLRYDINVYAGILYGETTNKPNATVTIEREPATVTEEVPGDRERYNREYNASVEAWNKYNQDMQNYNKQYQEYLQSAVTTTTEGTPNELYQSCQNTQFLIQGLLSGYLTLVNSNGDAVSLASATELTTEYDKTDDAAAEAVYNTEMAKINRKEKALDNEMKRLDTEHSALQTELESIKSIISNHASKDFELFS